MLVRTGKVLFLLAFIMIETMMRAGVSVSGTDAPMPIANDTTAVTSQKVTGGGNLHSLESQHRISSIEGNDTSAVYSETFHLYYKVNSNDIDPDYLDNAALIERIINHFRNSPRIDSVIVYSYASPEGSFSRNKYLSEKRAEAAKAYILRNLPDSSALDHNNIIMRPVPENWEGLYDIILGTYERPDRQKVIDILEDQSIDNEKRKTLLKKLDGGRTWRYILRECMPKLRYATWVCVWVPLPPEREPFKGVEQVNVTFRDTLVQHFLPLEPQIIFKERPWQEYRTILALKTNMLYDAATMLNFSIEAPINEQFSVQYQHYCPWWHNGYKSALQFLYMGGEARWWFLPKTRGVQHPDVLSGKYRQRDALMGHYAAIYASGGKFDFQHRDKLGMYQCYYWSIGASYGFSMPISRYLNLEFSISVGYANVDYQGYHPAQDWSAIFRDDNKTGTLHYFGPTKAEVSLVFPLRIKINKVAGGPGL
ncbi:MAG: DUF3575 domain-containing protein [Candidatus Cryptobacteroides sp.]